LTGFNTICR